MSIKQAIRTDGKRGGSGSLIKLKRKMRRGII